ncbi:Clp protease N-terminal domain-containing protein [Arthrobacter sp. B3I9]|uniref:Clp protease N-terminal domain-containing protein n=1 Tax=Arthrobacter sp. B3I9 TaxID=3042270 RepID=UPI00358FEE80
MGPWPEQSRHRASARIGVPSTAPEHLLIGLAAEAEGVAAKALRNSGITARTAEKPVTSDLDGRTKARRGKGAVREEAGCC